MVPTGVAGGFLDGVFDGVGGGQVAVGGLFGQSEQGSQAADVAAGGADLVQDPVFAQRGLDDTAPGAACRRRRRLCWRSSVPA